MGKITRESRKYFEIKKKTKISPTKTYKVQLKQCMGGKFLSVTLREISQIDNLTSPLKKLVKQEQTKLKFRKMK
jgi:hypothetical protein